VTLERLWAGWRSEYVGAASTNEEADGDCVLCRILASKEPPDQTYLLWRDQTCAAVLNAFPYTSGHLMVAPVRHEAEMQGLSPAEGAALVAGLQRATRALRDAIHPEAFNVGANLGREAGAGVPGHLHFHAVPRWSGDTNFMTSLAEVRVIPEDLHTTWKKLRAAWPT